jgi:cytidine deaminase
MQTKELRIFVYECTTIGDLPPEDQKLVLAARETVWKGYAPYSQFYVGAALLLENKEIFKGNNQENAAFTNGLCAERVALFYANATYPDVPVRALAVTAANQEGITEEPVKPCGSCRQALYEAEVRFEKPIHIILDGKKKIQVIEGMENLLPFAFKPDLPD